MFLLQASSWGNLKPGRGVFLKEECPVSSCVLASNRWQGAGAGAGVGVGAEAGEGAGAGAGAAAAAAAAGGH